MTDISTEFCIVGGGPGGLTLALLLLRSGAGVTVVERSGSLEREFRGEILQPGGMSLLDGLGVLGPARARGAVEHTGFRLVERGRTLLDIDYRRLPPPHNRLLSLPQPHLLAELLSQCAAAGNFRYLGGYRVSALLRAADGAVRGVTASGPAGECQIGAFCVVGADGRYSKTRRLAGITMTRNESFAQDVLWFKVPDGGQPASVVQIFRAAGNPVIVYGSYPGHVQLGWTLPHRGYAAIAERGVGYVREQIGLAIPQYAEAISGHIASLRDLTLLDVFSAVADTWSRDGLVLLGDSAHAHGPIGAQGINLAIQDAVLLHPVLMAALTAGDASQVVLSAFERSRRPQVAQVLRLQATQGRTMLSGNRVAETVRPWAARVLARTPVYPKILNRIAYGSAPVRVAAELFA
jgi:6-methylpretetramide 4-monooxygenase